MLKLLQATCLYAATAGVAAFFIFSSLGRGSSTAAPRLSEGAPRVVVVELFTSEGCSSCPPADSLLKELTEQQQINGLQVVALEEHVDYWNHLGWRDPYSAAEYSERQNDYSHVFGTDGVYTPQMIVDGQHGFVGSRRLTAREAIQNAAREPKVEIELLAIPSAPPGKPSFEVQIKSLNGISPRGDLELWLVVTEKGLQTDVKAGENSGETLKHAAIVRSLQKIDTMREPAGYSRQFQAAVDPNWKKENLAVVVLLTEKQSRRIIGAATTPFNLSRDSK